MVNKFKKLMYKPLNCKNRFLFYKMYVFIIFIFYYLIGIELKKKKFKSTNLLDASVKLNSLGYYDENRTVISSKRKILLFDLKNKKFTKTYNIEESGSIVGVFKHNK